jgi:hypothetical protein
VTVALGVALVLVLGILALALWSDPDRPVREMQQALAEGHPVELIGADGRPRWFRWRAGGAPLESSPGRATFAFNSYKVGLLELLPDPGRDSYRLQAEVRHDQGTAAGHVGLYFALGTYPAPRGNIHAFLAWTFNDVEPMKTGFPNKIALTLRLWRAAAPDGTVDGVSHKEGCGKPLPFPPALCPPRSGPWRRLAVTVTPDGVRTFWEGRLVNELSRAELVEKARLLLGDCPDLAGRPYEFRPRGGLGLLLDEGAATFKVIRVEPLNPGV